MTEERLAAFSRGETEWIIVDGYSWHNIDFPGQMASLLAGAGTLAYIAKNGLES